jgi:hypothetical protein
MKNFDQFHDGFLDGLLIQGANVHVFLCTDNREEFALELRGVLSLKADGFRKGNIIFDVLVRDGEDLTFHDIMNFFEFKDEVKALQRLEETRRKNLVVLEINPSYGASCIILAESVELLPRNEMMKRISLAADC